MKTMPNSTQEEKYRWIKPILFKEVSIKDMDKVCPFSKRALKYWLAAYRKRGLAGLKNKSTRPKTHSKEIPIRTKERIVEMRKETRECALKIKWDLEDEGVFVHHQTIQKIIKAEGLTRKYRSRKQKPEYIREPLAKGQMVEIDVKFVPGRINGQKYYQFTAIDCASRWRYLQVYDDISNLSAVSFVHELLQVCDFKIEAIKTDNGPCFTNRYTGYYRSDRPFPRPHAFDEVCAGYGIAHYLIDPGKPQQNCFVERSHRTDQEKFYDQNRFAPFSDLRYKLRSWNRKYNSTRHCGLNGLTPNQALAR
jgi:transposase InsO family protein